MALAAVAITIIPSAPRAKSHRQHHPLPDGHITPPSPSGELSRASLLPDCTCVARRQPRGEPRPTLAQIKWLWPLTSRPVNDPSSLRVRVRRNPCIGTPIWERRVASHAGDSAHCRYASQPLSRAPHGAGSHRPSGPVEPARTSEPGVYIRPWTQDVRVKHLAHETAPIGYVLAGASLGGTQRRDCIGECERDSNRWSRQSCDSGGSASWRCRRLGCFAPLAPASRPHSRISVTPSASASPAARSHTWPATGSPTTSPSRGRRRPTRSPTPASPAIPDRRPVGGCTVAGQTATCPRDGVMLVFIEVGRRERHRRSAAPVTTIILGGTAATRSTAATARHHRHAASGRPARAGRAVRVRLRRTAGGVQHDQLRVPHLPPGGSRHGGVMIDDRPDRDFASTRTAAFESIGRDPGPGRHSNSTTRSSAATRPRSWSAARAQDTLCGGLGVDTVDYSDSTSPRARHPRRRHADRPGPRDPADARPRRDGEGLRERYFTRPPRLPADTPADGFPVPDCIDPAANCTGAGRFGDRDCTADDGAWDGTTSEGDCVGEDVENIIGSASTTCWWATTSIRSRAAGRASSRSGANRIEGGGGDDVMDGRGGPDVYEGGEGTDTVTYGGSEAAGRLIRRANQRPSTRRSTGSRMTAASQDRNRAGLTDSVEHRRRAHRGRQRRRRPERGRRRSGDAGGRGRRHPRGR